MVWSQPRYHERYLLTVGFLLNYVFSDIYFPPMANVDINTYLTGLLCQFNEIHKKMLWNLKKALQILTGIVWALKYKDVSTKNSSDSLNSSSHHWAFTHLLTNVSNYSTVYFHYLPWLDRKGYILLLCVIMCPVCACVRACARTVCVIYGKSILILYFYLRICNCKVLFCLLFQCNKIILSLK